MNQKFLSNLAFLLAANLLVKPFYIFGIDRMVQVTVGTEMYGVYFALYNFSILFYIILDLGLTNYNNRTIAQNRDLLKSYLPNLIVVKLGLSFVFLGLLFLVAIMLGYDVLKLKLLLPLALNQILISFIFYFRSNITAYHYFKMDALISILDRLILIVVCSVLLWGSVVSTFKIEYFIYAQTFAYAITALMAFLVVLRFVDFTHLNLNQLVQKTKLVQILKESFPYALLILLMTLYNRIDGIMLERLLDDDGNEAGIYAAAYRLLDAVNVFGLLFASLLLPLFAKMLKDKVPIQNLTQTSFQTILAFSITVAIGCFIFQQEIMSLLYPEATVYWAEVFSWLMFSFIAISSVYIFGTLMTANANLRALNWIAISGVVLNVILNFILIPNYKAYGATIATVNTQALVAIAHIIWAIRLFNLKFSIGFVLRILGYGFLISIGGYFTYSLNLNWIIRFIAFNGLALIGTFSFKLIDIQLFVNAIRNR